MIGNLNNQRIRKKKSSSAIFLSSLLVLLCLIIHIAQYCLIPVCWAIWADPNTGIQNIIDQALPGDTVFVRKGCYKLEEIITMKENVSLIGAAEELGSVVFLGDPNMLGVIWAAGHTTIKNLVICNGFVGIVCPYGDANDPVKDITIEHNLIEKNATGIFIGAKHVNIINTTIVHNEERGILIDPNSPTLHGAGNIIAFNGPYGSIEFFRHNNPNTGLAAFLNLTTISLRYNDFYDDLYYTWLDSNNSLCKITINTSSFGPGNFSANPYFVDPNGGNYHLLSYSPCIDRGDPNSDYSLEPLPNGERVNLGIYGNTLQAAVSLDSDGDGPLDFEEFQEGLGDMDGDKLPDWQDGDTVIIPLPEAEEKIGLHFTVLSYDSGNQNSEQNKGFKEARAILPAKLEIAPPEGILPFGVLRFRVPDLDEGAIILVKMWLPEYFGALRISQYLALASDTSWSALSFEIEPNKTAITFTIEDGRIGDKDGINNGVIEHMACLVIPQSITGENPKSCFISLCKPFTLSTLSYVGLPSWRNYQDKYQKGLYPYDNLRVCLWALIFFPALFLIYCSGKKVVLGKRSVKVFFILFLVIFLSTFGWAEIKEDIEPTSSPNPVGSGARALGMGGAFISVADDATAASWNPAGLKHLGNPEISWVQTYSSRKECYRFEESPGASGEYRLTGWDVNYLSLSYPGRFFRKNYVVSLSCQHLYDFSKKLSSYQWQSSSEDTAHNMDYQASYEQAGGLRALSLASAVMVNPRLTFGLTMNIWSDKLLANEWIEKYHKDGQGVIVIDEDHRNVVTHVDIIEKFTFSGLNFNLGLLWDIVETFTLGVVYKTPFTAHIEHTTDEYRIEEYPDKLFPNKYNYKSQKENERLSMPRAYGLGLAWHSMDELVFDLDIYRTEWGDYKLIKPDGRRINPITGFNKSKVKVKPTYQIRLGAEYAFISPKRLIPAIRGGVFYDPSPAPNKPDDYYGASLGLGLTIREKKKMASRRNKRKERKDIMSIDVAYQYRWGKQEEGEIIRGENSPADVDHHLVYFSVIYYF